MWRVFVFQILFLTLVSASCPEDCRCSTEVPRCAAGVSLIPGSCGCCKVCARQLFENCSKTQPCDHTKGLQCNFGGRPGSAKGICRAKSDGRTCEYNNKIYQNGEIFRPNGKHQCTCMDGAVGCASLCPHKLLLHKLRCSKPERVRVGGQCCEQLISPRKHSRVKENELVPVWRGRAKSLAVFRSDPMRHVVARGVKCVSQTSSWSPCSKSCGTGVSTRTSNKNSQCRLAAETRICEVRSCNQTTVRYKKAQKCIRVHKASRPVHLWHSGCRSLKTFQPKHCGSCSDGRCCRPHHTQTVPVHFQCKTGEITRKMLMMIESCVCDLNCSDGNENTADPYRHLNDLHPLKHRFNH